MAGFDQSHEGLENLILRDQYFLTCDKALQIFLKEKGKLSLKDMPKLLMIITRLTVMQLITMITDTKGVHTRQNKQRASQSMGQIMYPQRSDTVKIVT